MDEIKGIEYFCYLSEHTITMLYEQIPEHVLQDISVELGIDVKLLAMKVAKGPNGQKKLVARLKAVLNYLEKHDANNIGTVDNPKKYFRGTLPMFSHFIPQGFGVKKPELIYYGGSTQTSIIGLGGAATYVLNKTGTEGTMREVSSALPYLTSLLAKESKIETIFAGDDWNDDVLSLDAIEYMERYNRKGKQIDKLKFFAKLKLDSEKIEGYDTKKRIILGSPLYVAYSD